MEKYGVNFGTISKMLILFLLIINEMLCLSKNSLKINVVYIINLFIFAASIDINIEPKL